MPLIENTYIGYGMEREPKKITGLFQMLLGITIFIGGIILGCTWIAFCFSSIIIGVLLLLLKPTVLLIPFSFGTVPGIAFFYMGLKNFRGKRIE
jgi:hypothetical protein